MMMRLAMQSGPPIGGPLNEEADLQQALSLFIIHALLIYNNTAQEKYESSGPSQSEWCTTGDCLNLALGARLLPSYLSDVKSLSHINGIIQWENKLYNIWLQLAEIFLNINFQIYHLS